MWQCSHPVQPWQQLSVTTIFFTSVFHLCMYRDVKKISYNHLDICIWHQWLYSWPSKSPNTTILLTITPKHHNTADYLKSRISQRRNDELFTNYSDNPNYIKTVQFVHLVLIPMWQWVVVFHWIIWQVWEILREITWHPAVSLWEKFTILPGIQ